MTLIFTTLSITTNATISIMALRITNYATYSTTTLGICIEGCYTGFHIFIVMLGVIMLSFVMLRCHDTQHKDNLHNVTQQSDIWHIHRGLLYWVSHFYCYAGCHYAECRGAIVTTRINSQETSVSFPLVYLKIFRDRISLSESTFKYKIS